MNSLRPLGSLAVLLIAVGIAGVLASVVTGELLFGATDVSAPAIVTGLVFAVAIFAFMAVGRPWKSWQRTPYW